MKLYLIILAVLFAGAASAQSLEELEATLSSELRDELASARKIEVEVPALVIEYMAVYERLGVLAEDYATVLTEAEAEDIRSSFEGLSGRLDELAVRIEEMWEGVFDSKSYAYNYMMDRDNQTEMLSLYEDLITQMREHKAQVSATGALIDYALQKRLLTEYEIALAEHFGDEAPTSLKEALSDLPKAEDIAALKPVRLKTRLEFEHDATGYAALATEKDKKATYRVEILCVKELTQAERNAIEQKEIVRGEGTFIVSGLDGAAVLRLRISLDTLTGRNPEMRLKLTKL